ncbi:MAG: LD-carboxypeptidase, partial [Candidatus Acidiferrales bacterium]
MTRPHKPPALAPGSVVTLVSPGSPADARSIARGTAELRRLGWTPRRVALKERPDGYFAASARGRAAEMLSALRTARTDAVICV